MIKISDKAEFFIFLLEKYAETKQISAKYTINLWKDAKIIDYINNMYELYHSERIENAIQDIERKLKLFIR